jgi:hypothetical protein
MARKRKPFKPEPVEPTEAPPVLSPEDFVSDFTIGEDEKLPEPRVTDVELSVSVDGNEPVKVEPAPVVEAPVVPNDPTAPVHRANCDVSTEPVVDEGVSNPTAASRAFGDPA